jgi:hypothetical protein
MNQVLYLKNWLLYEEIQCYYLTTSNASNMVFKAFQHQREIFFVSQTGSALINVSAVALTGSKNVFVSVKISKKFSE